jgi:hypothetical protein
MSETTRARCGDRWASESGTTLIETAIAVAILVGVLAGLMSMVTVTTKLTENEGHLSARTAEYAQDKMEQLLALAYSDAVSNTTLTLTASSGGTGLVQGGSADPSAPAAKYFDYLKEDGTPMCPCAGTAAPANWFYERVWKIEVIPTNCREDPGDGCLKQITVTATAARSVGRAPGSGDEWSVTAAMVASGPGRRWSWDPVHRDTKVVTA